MWQGLLMSRGYSYTRKSGFCTWHRPTSPLHVGSPDFFFLTTPLGLQDISSLTRDQTWALVVTAPSPKPRVLTTGPPGLSLNL